MKIVEVTIKGISPLLMNRPDLLDISDKAKEKLAGLDLSNQQFEQKQYRNVDGKLYIPETHLKSALISGGKSIKVKGKGKATYSKILGYAAVVEPAEILHKKTKLEKFIVLAVNPNTKGRNALTRPMLREWEADFRVEYEDDEIPEEVLKLALDNAGKRVGIGDWRPEKKGVYGRFIVTRFEEGGSE